MILCSVLACVPSHVAQCPGARLATSFFFGGRQEFDNTDKVLRDHVCLHMTLAARDDRDCPISAGACCVPPAMYSIFRSELVGQTYPLPTRFLSAARLERAHPAPMGDVVV